MILISSGSLCASPTELPTGYNQQYNILEMERINNTEIEFKLHSRNKTPESSFDNPVWCEGSFNSRYPEFTFKIEHKISPNLALMRAEKLIGETKYREAAILLEQEDHNDPFVRKFLLDCYQKLEDNCAILNRFSEPVDNNEAVILMNAAIDEDDKEAILNILELSLIKNSDDPSIEHLRTQLEGRTK